MSHEATGEDPADAGIGDAALLENILDMAATRTSDLTEAVYKRFFEKRPDAQKFFCGGEIARGHMLNEVIFLLLDVADRKNYVKINVTGAANDHLAYGIVDPSFYMDFFDALRDVIAELIGAAWTAEMTATWQRLCRTVMSSLPDAETFARHARQEKSTNRDEFPSPPKTVSGSSDDELLAGLGSR